MTMPCASCSEFARRSSAASAVEQDALEQAVDVRFGARRDVDEQGVAAVLLGHQPVVGELPADLVRVRVLLVDLVHRDDDRDVGRLGVVERLDGLRHHAVIGRHDQHDDVGGRRTAGPHGGERLVTRGVDEGDRPVLAVVLDVDLVGTDVLGDAAGLVAHDIGLADRVEQPRLAVVDVTHDGDDRRPGERFSSSPSSSPKVRSKESSSSRSSSSGLTT